MACTLASDLALVRERTPISYPRKAVSTYTKWDALLTGMPHMWFRDDSFARF